MTLWWDLSGMCPCTHMNIVPLRVPPQIKFEIAVIEADYDHAAQHTLCPSIPAAAVPAHAGAFPRGILDDCIQSMWMTVKSIVYIFGNTSGLRGRFDPL
jgi:hypothetical protein